MAVFLFFCMFLHPCKSSPLGSMAFSSDIPASHLLCSCAQGLPGQGGGMVWWRGWSQGWALCPMQGLLLISILLAGPPAWTNTGSPSSDSPPSSPSACLPPFLQPAFLPASLISPPPLAPGPSAGGWQAGRQRPRRGEGEVAVAAAGSGDSQQQGGRPSWGSEAGG